MSNPQVSGTRRIMAGPTRISVFASAGVVVETYDWLLFGLLTPIYKEVFFPASDQVVGFISVWAIFAVGMFMRPVGAIFYGWYGTRHGRQKMLVMTTMLMTIPMLVTAFIPPYAMWGMWSALIVLLMRMMQGFCVGGEYSGTVVYLCETAPRNLRGMVANTANGASALGGVGANAILLILTATLSQAQLESWGWRISYLVGALVALVAQLMRRQLPETRAYERQAERGEIPKRPLRSAVRTEWRAIIISMLLVGYAQITFYFIMTYLPTLFKAVGNQSQAMANLLTLVLSLILAVSSPFVGLLADRIGRRWTMAGSAIVIGVFAYPCFILLESTNVAFVFIGAIVLMAGTTTYWGGFSPAVVEVFSPRHRVAATQIGYNVGTAIFGGTMGVIVTALVSDTGNAVGPAIYMTAASVVAVIVALSIREQARVPIEKVSGMFTGSRPEPVDTSK